MTIGWSTLADIVTVETLATFAAGGVTTKVCQTYVATSPSKSALEACKKDLEHIAWRIKQLTPRQCQEIVVLNRKEKCKSVDEIKLNYLRLLDNNDELWEQYGESSIVQRRWYYSQLRMDIDNLRKQILVLQADILNTTTSRNKEADRLLQVQREQVEHQPPLLPPSSTTEPGPQTVEHYAQLEPSTPTIPGDYSLHGIYPPTAPRTAHITARPPSADMV